MPHRPSALAAALLALSLAATGCSSSDGASEPTTPTTGPIDVPLPLPELATTDLPELTTDPTPVWVSTRADGVEPFDVSLVDDLAFVSSESSDFVVDLESGTTLWRNETRDPGLPADANRTSPLVAGPSTDGPVAVASYATLGCAYGCPVPAGTAREQRGIVAYDVRTGDVAWGRGLSGSSQSDFLGRDRRQALEVRPVTVSVDRVLAQVGTPSVAAGAAPGPGDPAYAVGLDAATGELLWSVADVVARRLVGGVVLGLAYDDGDAAAAVALDADTGEELWRYPAPGTRIAMGSTSPRVVVVTDEDGTHLLSTTTGEPLDQQLPEGTDSCATWVGGDVDLACSWVSPDAPTDARLLTLDSDGAMTLSATPTSRFPLQLTLGGIVLSRPLDAPASVVDAAGRELLPQTEDSVVAVDDTYVALGVSAGAVDARSTSLTILRRD